MSEPVLDFGMARTTGRRTLRGAKWEVLAAAFFSDSLFCVAHFVLTYFKSSWNPLLDSERHMSHFFNSPICDHWLLGRDVFVPIQHAALALERLKTSPLVSFASEECMLLMLKHWKGFVFPCRKLSSFGMVWCSIIFLLLKCQGSSYFFLHCTSCVSFKEFNALAKSFFLLLHTITTITASNFSKPNLEGALSKPGLVN